MTLTIVILAHFDRKICRHVSSEIQKDELRIKLQLIVVYCQQKQSPTQTTMCSANIL